MRNGGSVSPGSSVFSVYRARVLADGGIVENANCAIAFLDSIGAELQPIYQAIYDQYYARVIADGGVIENSTCSIAFLESITLGFSTTELEWGAASISDWGESTAYNWG